MKRLMLDAHCATRNWGLAFTVAAVALLGLPAPAVAAACLIKDSPCYPWRIEAGKDETTLLEVIPNNATTGATYRICLCPPTKGVSIVFDFLERSRVIGSVPDASSGSVCRDFRILTSRTSKLKLRRDPNNAGAQDKGVVEGCFVTF